MHFKQAPLLSRFSRVRLCATPKDGSPPGSLPWDSPGKNTGVGCRFLLQCMKVKSESEVTQLCPTLCDPMDCSLPGFSVHGIFQARVLEWGAIAFSKISTIGIAFIEASQVVLVVKNSLTNAGDVRDTGWIPVLGRSLEEGVAVFLPGEFHGQRSQAGSTVHSITKSRT